jgi:hypothetical protein
MKILLHVGYFSAQYCISTKIEKNFQDVITAAFQVENIILDKAKF